MSRRCISSGPDEAPTCANSYFCPPSPWWLVRQGRYEDAQRSIMRLADNRHFSEEDAKRTVAMYIHTTELEKSTQAGTSYIDCFRGIDRRRTEIVRLSELDYTASADNGLTNRPCWSSPSSWVPARIWSGRPFNSLCKPVSAVCLERLSAL